MSKVHFWNEKNQQFYINLGPQTIFESIDKAFQNGFGMIMQN